MQRPVSVSSEISHLDDRGTIFGNRIPIEIKDLLSIRDIHQFETSIWKKIFSKLVEYLETGNLNTNLASIWEANSSFKIEDFETIISAFKVIMCTSMRHTALKKEQLVDDLKSLNIPAATFPLLSKLIFSNQREKLYDYVIGGRVRLKHIQRIKWRVDITIGNSNLQRVLVPTVLLEMHFSDNSFEYFEISIKKFHHLRFTIAHALMEIDSLEKKNILKIQ